MEIEAKRIFADTNLFLRYLTNDIPDQADAVEHLLQKAGAGEIVLVTNSLVIAEIIWTLESFYHLSKLEIHENVLAILNTPGLEVVDGLMILKAIHWFKDKNIDFIDAYNGAWMLDQGITQVCSFDFKHFSRLDETGIIVNLPGDQFA
jgi:predicted nucleic acid-binding protein